jgi:glycosyltransferase A (GT-A) superfamily protein (DUF2064 family)
MAESPPRLQAVIVDRPGFAPRDGGAALRVALLEDARELVSAMRLRPLPDMPADAARLADAAAKGALLVLFADVPAIPPLAVEAALDSLGDCDIALGGCADGSLYLLALREGLEADLLAELAAAALAPGAIHALADLCDDAGLSANLLPPWFRVASENELSFAESLARLSLMSEDDEEGFVADRLRVWFEQHARP